MKKKYFSHIFYMLKWLTFLCDCDLGVACFSVHIIKSNVHALNGQKHKLADTWPERHPTKLAHPGPSHADSGSETKKKNWQKYKLANTRPERHPTKLPHPGPSHADSGSEMSDEEMITENKTGVGDNEGE